MNGLQVLSVKVDGKQCNPRDLPPALREGLIAKAKAECTREEFKALLEFLSAEAR